MQTGAVRAQQDAWETIFAGMRSRQFYADIVMEGEGVLCGVRYLAEACDEAGIKADWRCGDGDEVKPGSVVARMAGAPQQIAVVEELAVGHLAKSSGIATAARRIVRLAGSDMRIVCSAWKNMAAGLKHVVAEAVACGGAAFRIADRPYFYLDKNLVRMLGGIEEALAATQGIEGRLKVIQLTGQFAPVAREAVFAAQRGADVLMIDTGDLADFDSAHDALRRTGLRSDVKLAFADGNRLPDIAGLRGRGIDILDVGAGIIDAPLLDVRMDVVGALHAAEPA